METCFEFRFSALEGVRLFLNADLADQADLGGSEKHLNRDEGDEGDLCS